MLIVDRNCANSKGGHVVNFSAFNCRLIVQKGGIIDLEKSVPIIKGKKMGDVSRVAAELLSRSQYEQVKIKELKSDPPKKAEPKGGPGKEANTGQPEGTKGKDSKKSEK